MTIYAFGCSIAHGADLVFPNQHKANTEFSYPNLVAQSLGVECNNYAVCGMSNEGIFHKTINVLNECDEATAVIVGWTSDVREYWEVDGRQWFFIPSWCATTHADNELKFIKDYTGSDINFQPRVCADEEQYLEILNKMYEYLFKYKFDLTEYRNKKFNYMNCIRLYCKQRNFKLIETSSMDNTLDLHIKHNLDNFGTWRKGLGHPTKEDHQQIAQQILLTL